ncbi:MAG: hypothetical protein KJ025_09865 [Burkholderiales bacterium]|nr:hypothetical protein [Burkholderiales bacterium]
MRRSPHARHGAGQPVASTAGQSSVRELVESAFRQMAHGVDTRSAQAQTLAFYRSGGQEWTRGLDRAAGHVVRARVTGAFRAIAHGAQAATSQARALRFYRSSGHAWADNLG